ncbi:MAG: hypothetical protein ACRBB0_23075 [Pelagimonas sp.]|uniref:hypothetical protein n=1 Tax=Pelagimonas sp. TaxID=2073170 RepID=UPI003D6BCD54
MSWFSSLTGIPLETLDSVRDTLVVQDGFLMSRANNHRYRIGDLTCPSLADLRHIPIPQNAPTQVSEVIANVQDLHRVPANAGAFFQVASQFNLLEMIYPSYCPEDGVTLYQDDLTQGPACAIACGAGTIFRNYFVPLGDQIGQSSRHQINCLAGLANALNNDHHQYWQMQNGYALPTPDGLSRLNAALSKLTAQERDLLKATLQIGIQQDTEVTLGQADHLVTQAFCSALPVAYGHDAPDLWEPLARIVLEASYEATLLAALRNTARTGNNRVFLTLIGGGAFGNRFDWIEDAVCGALETVRNSDLDVQFVSYASSSHLVQNILKRWETT